MRDRIVGMMLVCVVLLTASWVKAGADASTPGGVADQKSAIPARLHAFVFACDDGTTFTAHFPPAAPESVVLYLPDETVTLPQVRSGSGARYEANGVLFWNKSRQAILERTGKVSARCVEDRRQSVVEDARLRGVWVWATGNEPGWQLEVGPDGIVYLADYGWQRRVFAWPEGGYAPGRSKYEAQADGETIRVRLTKGLCTDTMSGEQYLLAVRVELNGKTVSGCGMELVEN